MATMALSLPLLLPKATTQFHTANHFSFFFLSQSLTFSSPSILSPFPARPVTHLPFCSPSASVSTQDEEEEESSMDDSIVDEEESSEEEEDDDVDPTAEVRYLDPEVNVESIREWEVDFCSRPILDERGKKIWELVICDSTLSLQFTRYFPNNVINSVTLKDAISSVVSDFGLPLPDKIRFFRSQMITIITKACSELGIKPVPSKRCISLLLWLEERYEAVYMKHPGFQKGSKPLLTLDNPFPMKLPENLFGEQWAFVQVPFSEIQKELSMKNKSYAFGRGLDLDLLGFEFDETTLVPGLAVASTRSKALAAWMNGLEICAIETDTNRASLILSVGVNTTYVYATYQKSAAATQEAEAWESSKKACGGLHFLAIQEKLDSEGCVGFWLLLDLPPPPV